MRRNLLIAGFSVIFLAYGIANVNAAGVGERCAGFAGVMCDKGLWCDPDPGSCGVMDAQGKCVRVVRGCPKNIHYVCGCNHKTYTNDCVRRTAHIGKDYEGKCNK